MNMKNLIQNKLYDEINVGDSATAPRKLKSGDMHALASAFGDAWSADSATHGKAAIGAISMLFSSLVESSLPGPGSSILDLNVKMVHPLPVGKDLLLRLDVREKDDDKNAVILDGSCVTKDFELIATASMVVVAPLVRIECDIAHHRLEQLIKKCKELKPMLTGVVHPCGVDAIQGAIDARNAGIIDPVFYGPEDEIRTIARNANIDLSGVQFVNTTNPDESAMKAAKDASCGNVASLMKGSLHTDIFLHAILAKESGLRTGRLLSHCTLLSVPTYSRQIVLTDVALNIAPDTKQKKDICQNAIGFAKAMGIETPKVAVLAAVETVRPQMQASLDAALLAKMSDRGQIVGGIVDGPLALDNAVDKEAARIKKIKSPVAGEADVLLVPNIEAGNMVYKNLVFMADAQMAGLVVGAKVPIILTSRADTAEARLFSAAAGALYAHALAENPNDILPVVED